MNYHSLISLSFFITASATFCYALRLPPRHRLVWALPLVASSTLAFRYFPAWSFFDGNGTTWGHLLLIWTAHATSVLYLDRVVLRSGGCDDQIAETRVSTSRYLYEAYKLWNNPRRLPSYPARSSQQQHRVFIMSQVCLVSTTYILRNIMLVGYVSHAVHQDDFVSPLPALSLRALSLRMHVTLIWLLSSAFSIQLAHSVLSIIFVVLLRLDVSEEWPPLFGSLSDITSVRSFWGKFWHQIARKSLISWGKWTFRRLHCVLRLLGWDKPSRQENPTFIALFVFVASGMMHSLLAAAADSPGSAASDTIFFLANFGAAALESFLARRVRKLLQETTGTGPKSGNFALVRIIWPKHWRVIWKAASFTWVMVWLCLTVPMWQYPKIHARYNLSSA